MALAKLQETITKENGFIFSEGTLKTEDLLSTTYSLLTRFDFNIDMQNQIKELFIYEPTVYNVFRQFSYLPVYNESAATELWNETVTDYLNGISPEGYHFGSTEGDGACFGWFKVEAEYYSDPKFGPDGSMTPNNAAMRAKYNG